MSRSALAETTALTSYSPAPPPVAFDYSTLDDSLAAELRDLAERIRSGMKKLESDMLAIGKALLAAKERIPHGQFAAWVQLELGYPIRTAQRYMAAAKRFETAALTLDLPPGSVVQLALTADAETALAATADASPKVEELEAEVARLIASNERAQADANRAFKALTAAERSFEDRFAAGTAQARQEEREAVQADIDALEEELTRATTSYSSAAKANAADAARAGKELAEAEAEKRLAEKLNASQETLDAIDAKVKKGKADLKAAKEAAAKAKTDLAGYETKIKALKDTLAGLNSEDAQIAEQADLAATIGAAITAAQTALAALHHSCRPEAAEQVRKAAALCRQVGNTLADLTSGVTTVTATAVTVSITDPNAPELAASDDAANAE